MRFHRLDEAVQTSPKPEPRAKKQCQGRPNTVSAAQLTPGVGNAWEGSTARDLMMFSPLTYASSDFPPTCFLHGNGDTLVGTQESFKMCVVLLASFWACWDPLGLIPWASLG